MPSATPPSTRRTKRIFGGLIGLFVTGLLLVWWRIAGDDSAVMIPTPSMPSPNGYDTYWAAEHALVGANQIDNVGNPSAPKPMTLEQKEAILQRNAPALQILHQGFVYEYRSPPVRSNDTPVPHYADFLRIPRLLALQSRVRGARGDWSGAADSALDAIRIGEDIPRGGISLIQGIGLSGQSIGRKPMWAALEHLNAAQARVAAQRLQTILDRHVPYAETLQEEKWFGQATLEEILRSVNLRNALAATDTWIGGDAPPSQRYSTAFSLLYGRKGIRQSYIECMDALSDRARRPYAAKLPPPVPNDFLNQAMDWVYEAHRFDDVRAETQNRLLLVSLALRAYRLEHGGYPVSLAELAPAYLKQIPDDPFALKGAFLYRINGQKYVLYSVGPDGKDNGGTPIDDPKLATAISPNARYNIVKQDSVGDIVAGKNLH